MKSSSGFVLKSSGEDKTAARFMLSTSSVNFLLSTEQMNSNDCFHFRRPDLSVVQSFNEGNKKLILFALSCWECNF